jgi:catechol 2,3-dioxygenase-like lactoylglutathione lyase family enzyme
MRQHLSAIALVVRDYDEAINYYTKVLGFELIEDTDMSVGHNSQPGKRWVRVKPRGSLETSFLLAKAATADGGRVFLFLNTDDFWRDYHAMSAHGVTWVRPPSRETYGTVAVFADLYGNKWDLIGPNVDEK